MITRLTSDGRVRMRDRPNGDAHSLRCIEWLGAFDGIALDGGDIETHRGSPVNLPYGPTPMSRKLKGGRSGVCQDGSDESPAS